MICQGAEGPGSFLNQRNAGRSKTPLAGPQRVVEAVVVRAGTPVAIVLERDTDQACDGVRELLGQLIRIFCVGRADARCSSETDHREQRRMRSQKPPIAPHLDDTTDLALDPCGGNLPLFTATPLSEYAWKVRHHDSFQERDSRHSAK